MAVHDRYALLSSVVRIANSADLSYIARLRALTRYLAKQFPADSVTIYLLDEDRRHLSRYVSSIGSGKECHCYLPLGEGAAGLCAANRAVLRLNREALHPDEPRTGNETSLLAIPLNDCGVMLIGLGSPPHHAFEEIEGLRDILTLVDGLLQRIRLSESSAVRVRNLTRLSAMAQLLNRPLPPREMLTLILDGCFRNTDACCIVLRLFEEKGLPAGVFKKYRGRVRPQLREILATEVSCSALVADTGLPQLACDLIAEGEFPPSYVCVPLQFKTRLLGTLTFFGKKGRSGYCRNFNGEDRDVFENLAILIANALAEAANYDQLVLLLRENDKKVKELSFLNGISNVMLSTIRLNKLVHLILAALVSAPHSFFERAMLFLINERSGVMQGMFGVTREAAEHLIPPGADAGSPLGGRWDVSEEELSRQESSEFCREVRASRLEIDKALNLCSRAVLEKRVILVADAAREKRIDRDFVTLFGLSSFAVAPLMAKEQVVGVVFVDNPLQGKPISRDDLHFLQLFANQAGMAIENSMLYNRLEDANRNLREARERLVHGARLATIGEMSANIAHELKGPLVSMGGFARRLEKKLLPGSAEAGYAATIAREVQRLEKLLTDTLSFARKATICYTHCDIVDIIEDALSIVGPALEEKELKVSKSFPRNIITFLGDPQQLKQVFINLFLNSSEANPPGGKLDIVVAPARLEGKKAVSIKVIDSGGGVPQEILNQIFTPFYTTKDEGTGLGLPIANRLVLNHGGKIQLNNSGGGAEFNVILPLVG